MKITVRPMSNPGHELDVTHRLIAAIAEELWLFHGGNEQLNWLEAERHLEALVAHAQTRLIHPAVAAPVEITNTAAGPAHQPSPPPRRTPHRAGREPTSRKPPSPRSRTLDPALA